MADYLAGSFTATGQSPAVKGAKGMIFLAFGTGTVQPQVKSPAGVWHPFGDAYTASGTYRWDFPEACEVRLDCTAYTAEIDYELRASAWAEA